MYSVVAVLVLSDNYSYILVDEATKTAAVIDPVEPEKVLARAKELGVEVTTVLTTHSHWDHAGGNTKISELLPTGTRIIGGKGDNAEAVTQEVGEGDIIELGELKIQTIYTPCHTPGHVCFYIPGTESAAGAVFTGDTMFVGGCGNFNAGTPKQMYENMLLKLGKLPSNTNVYVGHEYTVRNLQFGLYAEPNNERLKEKLAWAENQRSKGLPTIPSTIGDEWATNPFMRIGEDTIKQFTGTEDLVEGMREVRKLKDVWGRTH
eukprot:TRINITY_DN5562_c1_g1_i1.p1 TRINITY_DN5562_c1_g1~~TRINITY_DN5562_c1_g1_i1.p1  ORF type:complete len:271 (-),score=48.11 TRINITY_DN5562_c1_g1_i1:41-826(-)